MCGVLQPTAKDSAVRTFAKSTLQRLGTWCVHSCPQARVCGRDGSIRRADRYGRAHTQHNSGLELCQGVALTLPHSARAARAEANALQEPQLRWREWQGQGIGVLTLNFQQLESACPSRGSVRFTMHSASEQHSSPGTCPPHLARTAHAQANTAEEWLTGPAFGGGSKAKECGSSP